MTRTRKNRNSLLAPVLCALAFSSLHAPRLEAEPVPAEAEVSASSGPVKLILRVYKTKLKLHKRTPIRFGDWKGAEEMGEPLWVQIGITNIGKNRIWVTDDLFTGGRDFRRALERFDGSPHGIHFEVRDPHGKEVRMDIPMSLDLHDVKVVPTSPDHLAKIREWRKAGYSLEKARQLLDELNRKESEQSLAAWEEKNRRAHPAKRPNPGDTVWTSSYAYHGDWKPEQFQRSAAIGDFAELANYALDKPGIYRIRLVYNKSPSPWDVNLSKTLHSKIDEEDVRVATPWIKIRVSR